MTERSAYHESEDEMWGPTYIDVLALATARTSNTKFHADTFSWAKAIQEGQKEAVGVDPEFLADLHFEEFREGYLWSDQVHAFLNIMGKSGAIEVGSPRYKIRVFDQKAKEDFLANVDPRLDAQSEAIAYVTQAIDSIVGIG
ncbi:MAG: hypothetical protein Q7T54_00280 [Candidatus Levybacteria bacterium]|nr:hypothetical protein [Candidatus Levybacteria bacterium]